MLGCFQSVHSPVPFFTAQHSAAMSGPKPRRTQRRCAARTQLCACLSCFGILCQALAFSFYRSSRVDHVAADVERTREAPLLTPPTSVLPRTPLQLASTAGAAGSSSARSGIPHLIHQSWRDGGFPKTLFNWRWQQGLLDLNPGWKLMKWTDESSRQLIADHYPWFLPTYDAYPSYIQRCDASRYFIVYHYGGERRPPDCGHGDGARAQWRVRGGGATHPTLVPSTHRRRLRRPRHRVLQAL